MKTKYRPSRRPINLGKETIGTVIVVILFLIFITVPFMRDSVVSSYSKFAWFVREFTFTTFDHVVNPWNYENTATVSSSTTNTQIELLQKENDSLKELLGRKPNIKSVLGRVLTKPPQAPYDQIVLDIGMSEGVSNGASIYDSNNSLIGFIDNASQNVSVAKLYSSPGVQTEAEILRSGVVLSLVGEGDGSFSVEVPRDFDAKIGDMFIISGTKTRPLAQIEDIKIGSADSFKTVYAKGLFEPRKLTWVFVEVRNN